MTVEILMATYNGASFLREQLESIFSQTWGDWRLLIRDDGSTDQTLAILEESRRRDPERVHLVHDSLGRLGATRNFARLLDLSAAPYVMFSDQDDVWLPHKIGVSLEAMSVAEHAFPDLPIVVHTDLIVVDAQLHRHADSFWRFRGFPITAENVLRTLLRGNFVTGCTMIVNRRAIDNSVPIPQSARLHDWWIALNVAQKGRLISLMLPTVLYRQHGSNTIGAHRQVSLSPTKLLAELNRFQKRLHADYVTAKQILPAVSFWSWCVRYMQTLVRGQIRGEVKLHSVTRGVFPCKSTEQGV